MMKRRGVLLAIGGVLLVWATLVLLTVSGSAQAGNSTEWLETGETVYIEPSDAVVVPGTTFTIAVNITETLDLGAFEFDLVYSPTLVSVTGVSLCPLLGSTGRTVISLGPEIDNAAGEMSYGAISFGTEAGPSGMGTLAIITLTSTLTEGTTILDLRNVQTTDTEAKPRIPIALGGTIVTDDDVQGPDIATPDYPESAGVDEPLVVTADISDAGTGDHGVTSATLFYGYTAPYTQWSVAGTAPTGPNGDGTWTFTIPPQGEEHEGETLRFLLEAVDGDNSPATGVQDNGGAGFPVTISTGSAETIHVQRIKMRYSLVGKTRYKVTAEVRIVDDNNQAVSGATVYVLWTLPNGTDEQESETKTTGTARFTVSSTQTGSYEICVTDVVKEGWLYDPDQPDCETLMVN
jgi:hypothetical protein